MDRDEVLEAYLNENKVINIATQGENGIWCFSAFYGYCKGKFYFTSKTSKIHSKNIGNGSEIAFTITSSSLTPDKPCVGIQGKGFCRPAKLSEAMEIFENYGKLFIAYKETFGNFNKLKELISGGFNIPFVIEVSTIKFLHEERFGGYENFTFDH